MVQQVPFVIVAPLVVTGVLVGRSALSDVHNADLCLNLHCVISEAAFLVDAAVRVQGTKTTGTNVVQGFKRSLIHF